MKKGSLIVALAVVMCLSLHGSVAAASFQGVKIAISIRVGIQPATPPVICAVPVDVIANRVSTPPGRESTIGDHREDA